MLANVYRKDSYPVTGKIPQEHANEDNLLACGKCYEHWNALEW